MSPRAHIRSQPPTGAQVSFGAAQQETAWGPQAHIRSQPPTGAQVSFGAAQQET
jgi:hypothetical protein